MDRKTENQLREELAAAWGMLDAERREAAELRKNAERYLWLVANTSHHLYNSAWIGSLTAVKDGPCDILSADEGPGWCRAPNAR